MTQQFELEIEVVCRKTVRLNETEDVKLLIKREAEDLRKAAAHTGWETAQPTFECT